MGKVFKLETKSTKRKWFAIGLVALFVLLGLGCFLYFYRVRIIGEEQIGGIWKDEKDNVTATCFVTLYNGTFSDKIVQFDVDGGEEYQKGMLEKEKYEVDDIIILKGNGQVDMEKKNLLIPAHEKITIEIVAVNTYILGDYQGEKYGLRRSAPDMKLVVLCP